MAKRIVIVGGGVIGLTTALYSARKGHQVTVLDRNGPGEGCSYGNAGMIVPSHFIPLAAPGMVALGLKWMWNPRSPFYIRPRLDRDLLRWAWRFYRASNAAQVARAAPLLRDLHLASRAEFEDLAARPGMDFGLMKKGLLMLCQSEAALEEEAHGASRATELGIPAQVLNAKETGALEPRVRMNIAGAVYFPKDCHLSPSRLMECLQDHLKQAGVLTRWRTQIQGWHSKGERIDSIRTSDGELSADEFVVCGGAWSPNLIQELGLDLPTQAGKGYSVTLPKPRQLPQICSILTEARVAVTPMGESLRVGGTMEMAGLNHSISSARVEGITRALAGYYPEFQTTDFQGLPVWHGLRPCSPDGLPYLGRTRHFTNLGIATGHAMMGLSLAPVTGRLISEILSDETPSLAIGLLDPDRFGRWKRGRSPNS